MVYQNEAWRPVEATMTNDGLQLNLYDLNKQIVGQLPPLDEVRIQDAIETLNAWHKVNYYMLYGKEISYFTIMRQLDTDSDFINFGEGVISLLHDISDTIYVLDVLDDNTVEIWLNYEGTPTVIYLFNYESGVVTYGA